MTTDRMGKSTMPKRKSGLRRCSSEMDNRSIALVNVSIVS